MFSIQISSQVHQKIALGLHCRIICAAAHLGGALGGFKGLSLAKFVEDAKAQQKRRGRKKNAS